MTEEWTYLPAASEDAAGMRMDAYLAMYAEDLSRNGAQKLIADSKVLCNGIAVNKKTQINPGDVICFLSDDPIPCDALPEDIPLDIMYEDSDLAVINKPQGMCVHPAPGNESGTLVNALLYHFGDGLSGINGILRPGIVHRIDKNTSGLLMVAKNDHAHRALAAQIEEHSFLRVYEAIVLGVPSENEGTISRPIGRNPKDRKKMAIVADGRPATTHYRLITPYRGYAHIECRLETGRTHQIRVHMAGIGHPVLGDDVYGRPLQPAFRYLTGQVLCARRLGFSHPSDGRWMEFSCELPDHFQKTLEILNQSFS